MIYKFINIVIGLVWLINGLFCKVLNLVPRHEQIVFRITGMSFSKTLTIAIGILEIFIAIWIFSKIKYKLNAFTQMIIIALMNILEFILVPDLLLWGRFNILFASLLILVIYVVNFQFKPEYYGNNS